MKAREGHAGPPVTWEQIQEIRRRVGLTGPERLQWAVGFAQRDLDRLTPGEWTDLLVELKEFIASPFPRELEAGSTALRLRPHRPSLLPVEVWPRESLTDTDCRKTQQAFQRIFTVLVARQWVDIGELTLSPVVYVSERPGHPHEKGVYVEALTDSVITKALFGLTYLLGAHGGLLRECPEPRCHRLFVASRTNQVYCSTRCLSRKSTRKFRERRKAEAHSKRHNGRKKR